MKFRTPTGCFLLLYAFTSSDVFAQGEDGTAAERNLMIMSEMLAGEYDNANQSYFDTRLKKPDDQRHERKHLVVEKVTDEKPGETMFKLTLRHPNAENPTPPYWFTLEVDYPSDRVRMKTYRRDDDNYNHLEKCDLLWREEAGQFHGLLESGACRDKTAAKDMLLSEGALWVSWSRSKDDHFTFERARRFSCYVDVPGVGGGRDIPYKRYRIESIHDLGGESWVRLDDGSEVSVSLRRVKWPMNNLRNVFTRHSLVLYIGKKESADQESKEISYTWTSPDAQRIGLNLMWMLTNCYMLSNEDVTPYFKHEPKL